MTHLAEIHVTDSSVLMAKRIDVVLHGKYSQYVTDQTLLGASADYQMQVISQIVDRVLEAVRRDLIDQLVGFVKPLGASGIAEYKEKYAALVATAITSPLLVPSDVLKEKYSAPMTIFTPEAVEPEHEVLASLTKAIPALKTAKATCPHKGCSMKNPRLLPEIIIHLNDQHKWKREDIADWLDTLDVDLSFKTPEEVKS